MVSSSCGTDGETRTRNQAGPSATLGSTGPARGAMASPRHVPGVSSHAEYAAVGKAPDPGKDVTAGRSPHRHLLPDTVGPAPHAPTALRGIANKARADQPPRFRERYRCLDATLLRACWEALHKAAARGVDQVTAKAYAVNLQARIGNSNGLLAPPRRRRPPQHPPPAAPLCARLFRAAQSAAAASPERPGARRSTALHGVGWGWTGAAGWGRGARRDALE